MMLAAAAIVLDVAMLAFVAALISCLARRWRTAATLATLVALVGAAVLLFVLGRLVFASSSSDSLGRAVLPLVVTLAGLGVRAFARRQAR